MFKYEFTNVVGVDVGDQFAIEKEIGEILKPEQEVLFMRSYRVAVKLKRKDGKVNTCPYWVDIVKASSPEMAKKHPDVTSAIAGLSNYDMNIIEW